MKLSVTGLSGKGRRDVSWWAPMGTLKGLLWLSAEQQELSWWKQGKTKSYRSSHGNIRLRLLLCGKRKVIKTSRKSIHKSVFGFKVITPAEILATDRGDKRIQLVGDVEDRDELDVAISRWDRQLILRLLQRWPFEGRYQYPFCMPLLNVSVYHRFEGILWNIDMKKKLTVLWEYGMWARYVKLSGIPRDNPWGKEREYLKPAMLTFIHS